MLTGAELATMSDEALWHARRAHRRSSPRSIRNQKERIIRALRKTGHVVGYLGDGINDAPALHAADVGISVDTRGGRRQGSRRHRAAASATSTCCAAASRRAARRSPTR